MKIFNEITVSIVSHGQFQLLKPLLKDLKSFKFIAKIILTINIDEEIKKPKWINELPITWIYNTSVKGFGSNHNNAFKLCKTKYFIVLNPDIRLRENVFIDLIKIKEQEKINIIGPLIKDSYGRTSINSRKFPNIFFLFNKLLLKKQSQYFYQQNKQVMFTDWIGGMFVIISKNDFKLLNGFDEDYFLYFEDVDLCKRSKNLGFVVAQSKNIEVIHDAQRKSHHHLIYFLHHLKSYFLFMKKHFFSL